MKLYTKDQVEKSIAKGRHNDPEIVQQHIDSVRRMEKEGRSELEMQFSFGVICDNEKK